MDGKPARVRKPPRRRIARALLLMVVLAVACVAGLPWIVGTPPARRLVVSAVNRVLAPSRVTIDALAVSWIRPSHLSGLKLVDAHGKTLVDARQAVVERGLAGLLWNPRRIGTVVLEGARIDIERRADGSIDLVDALSPPRPTRDDTLASAPSGSASGGVDLSLRVVRGALRLRSPELAAPIAAEQLDMEVKVSSASGEPVAWRIRLRQPEGEDEARTLGIDGTFDLSAASDPDLTLHLDGKQWPFVLAGTTVGVDASIQARLDGLVLAERKQGRWTTTGDAKLLEFTASGPALAGDQLRLESATAAWEVAAVESGWRIEKLAVSSPVFTLQGAGNVDSALRAPAIQARASLDLAALSRQLPHAMRLRPGLTLERGAVQMGLRLSAEDGRQRGEFQAEVTDLAARDATHAFTLREPASLILRAHRMDSGFSVEKLQWKSAFLNLEGSGDLERGVNVTGTMDLGVLQTQLREIVDFGAIALVGKGRMAADYRKTPQGVYVARCAAEARGLDVSGLSALPITRDVARVDAIARGPVDASGLPADWESARVNLTSSRDNVAITATNKAGAVALDASASVPMLVLEREGQVSLRVLGRLAYDPKLGMGSGVADLDELTVSAVPTEAAMKQAGAIMISARGRFDLGADSLALTPRASAPEAGAPLVLGPAGIMAVGMRRPSNGLQVLKVAATGDLAALDRVLAVWRKQPANGLAGTYRLDVGLGPNGSGATNVGVALVAQDLSRPGSDGRSRIQEGPASLTCLGIHDPKTDRFEVTDLKLMARYGVLGAAGVIDEPTGRRVASLSGTLAPNWSAVSALVASMVEPNARLEGGARPFRLEGPLTGDSLVAILKGLEGEVGLDVASADLFGMRLGPAPIVVRLGSGGATIEPIVTTLNDGKVDLKPGLDLDEARGIVLTLAPGSSLDGVKVNDEVSKRVLRYVAPVLDQATHVNGRIALNVEKAEFPMTGPPDRRMTLTGRLVFEDVVFAPGPFAGEVLALAGRPGSEGLKLHQPVQLSVANGRVMQRGLEIPVARGATLALEGSIGFDETLDMRATVPITQSLLGRAAGVMGADAATGGPRVTVPIGGTVSRPRVNRDALRVALEGMSRDMLQRGLSRQATNLLDRVVPGATGAGDRAPGAPGAGAAPRNPIDQLGDQLLRRIGPKPRGTPPPPARPPGGAN